MRLVMITLLCCAVSVTAWADAPKLEELPGMYAKAKKGQWARYEMRVRTAGTENKFDVTYRITTIPSYSVDVKTTRVLEGQSRGRGLTSAFKVEKTFEDQLLETYRKQGVTELKVTSMLVTGASKVVVGGKSLSCWKVTSIYSGKVGGKKVTAREVYHLASGVGVMGAARIEATYTIEGTQGATTQKIDLVLKAHGTKK